YRHQHGLCSRTYPGPTATPNLAQEDSEADRQLGLPVRGVQTRLTQEGEQLMPMVPQMLRQRLVGRIRLGRENQVGESVLQAAAGHAQAVTADLPRGVTITQIQASPEQFSHSTRKMNGSPRRRRHHVVGTPQQVVEALLMQGFLELIVRGPAI